MKCPLRSHSRNATVSSTSSGARTAGAARTAASMRSTTASIAREVTDGRLQIGERLAHGRDQRLALLRA